MTLPKLPRVVLCICAQLLIIGAARADETITWNREPINVTLIVDQERRIDFPDNVRIGVPVEIADPAKFRTQSLSGSVYWKALQPFATQRIYATLMQSGHIVVFDVSARARGTDDEVPSPAPMKVVFPDGVLIAKSATAPSAEDAANASGTAAANIATDDAPISAIALSRFAAQQLYAPTRLLRDVPGIQRVPMHTPPVLPHLYAGGEVRSEPIASWQGGGLYVTAIKLSNLTATTVVVDPRKLRGQLLHATFQHRSLRLGPLGSATDTTTVYVITARPFAEAVLLKG